MPCAWQRASRRWVSPKYRALTRKSGQRYVWTGKIRCDEKALDIPRTRTRPRRIFVNSMSDLFHEDVPVPFIRKVWQVMQETPRHTYQILTKRPERMLEAARDLPLLPNVWLGAAWAAEYLRRRLASALRDRREDELFAFYRCHRAMLRARLAIAHLLEPDPRTPEKWPPLAHTYLRLALADAKRLERTIRTRAGR